MCVCMCCESVCMCVTPYAHFRNDTVKYEYIHPGIH